MVFVFSLYFGIWYSKLKKHYIFFQYKIRKNLRKKNFKTEQTR